MTPLGFGSAGFSITSIIAALRDFDPAYDRSGSKPEVRFDNR